MRSLAPLTSAEIQAIAHHVALALFDMGHRNPAPFAREFAASANVHRSLAEYMSSGEAPVQPVDEQQVLEWSQA